MLVVASLGVRPVTYTIPGLAGRRNAMSKPRNAGELENAWAHDVRWQGVRRAYSGAAVGKLRGTVHVEHTLARRGAERLWRQMQSNAPVRALGALTGNQAIQQVAAG